MPSCPQCTKPLAELTRHCPSCKADLDLLVDYVRQLGGGLKRAELLTRAGELDLAVWAYLDVLEVDPDNAEARKQVGRVVTAIRQFDRTSNGRRWIGRLRGELPDDTPNPAARWMWAGLIGVLVLGAFLLGYGFASRPVEETPRPMPPAWEDVPKEPPPKVKDAREPKRLTMRPPLCQPPTLHG